MHNLYIVYGRGTDPYANLALEEHLMQVVPPCGMILYLWQNMRTVVIGRNQSAAKECHLAELNKDGGHLARRLSGGGAVYHDLGNLNFTFIAPDGAYDVNRQTHVILRAVRGFGLDAQRTGRNDIEIDGRKFSGNAYYSHGGKNYHHGTIMLDVDSTQLSKYLTVSADKLKSRGVDSVRSRVVNLCELMPGLTVPDMMGALKKAFSEEFGLPVAALPEEWIDEATVEKLRLRNASDAWLLGRDVPCTFCAERRFAWGGVTILLEIAGDLVRSCAVYSDAMDAESIARLPGLLSGKRLAELRDVLDVQQPIFQDILLLMEEELHV